MARLLPRFQSTRGSACEADFINPPIHHLTK